MSVFSNVKALLWDFDCTKAYTKNYRQEPKAYEDATILAVLHACRERQILCHLTEAEMRASVAQSFKTRDNAYELMCRQFGLNLERVHELLHDFLDINQLCSPIPGFKEAFEDAAAGQVTNIVITHASGRWADRGVYLIGVCQHYPEGTVLAMGRDFPHSDRKDETPNAVKKALEIAGVPPEQALFIEDSPVNTLPSHQIGVRTVIVGDKAEQAPHAVATFPTSTDFLREFKYR